MNILLLTTHLNIGGITSYLLTLGKGLKERGHRVAVVSSGGEMVERFREVGIDCITLPIKTKAELHPKIIFASFRLKRLISENNFELLHAHTRVTQVMACLLHHLTKRPYISTCHGFFRTRISRRLFPCWGSRVIAISEPVKEHLTRDFNIPEERIDVVYNGIDIEYFRGTQNLDKSAAKERFGLGKGKAVGLIARFSDVKGHLYLIEAMQKVIQKIPDARLLLCGSGKMHEQMLKLINELQIANNVKIIPPVEDTREVLSALDLFVMPSINEGLGLGLMEAMAGGVCVVGTDVGGIKDLIKDGVTGVLVPAKNIEKLAEIMIKLLTDDRQRRALEVNAQAFINSQFSREKMAEGTEKVYKKCLNSKI